MGGEVSCTHTCSHTLAQRWRVVAGFGRILTHSLHAYLATHTHIVVESCRGVWKTYGGKCFTSSELMSSQELHEFFSVSACVCVYACVWDCVYVCVHESSPVHVDVCETLRLGGGTQREICFPKHFLSRVEQFCPRHQKQGKSQCC